MKLMLRDIRKKNGLTQGELADLAGTTLRKISAWERGETPIPLEEAAFLADVLKCSLDEMAGRTWPRSTSNDNERDALIGYYESMNSDARRKLVDTAELMSAGVKARIEKEVPEDHPDQTAMGA